MRVYLHENMYGDRVHFDLDHVLAISPYHATNAFNYIAVYMMFRDAPLILHTNCEAWSPVEPINNTLEYMEYKDAINAKTAAIRDAEIQKILKAWKNEDSTNI